MRKTVLVTGIGGNVGQGILRNIISCKYNLKIVGTNTFPVSAGNYLCDAVYTVPTADSVRYIPVMKKLCEAEEVDLIIPSTDAETYYLSRQSDALPELSSSKEEVALAFFNKLKTWQVFRRLGIPFAETVLPSAYKNNFQSCIVKPVTGRGSRNIFVNPERPGRFSDDYIVQRLYKGTEITTAFYVTKHNTLHGYITFTRTLVNGMTQQCEVTNRYDSKLRKILKEMVSHLEIKGSCNIQSIIEASTGRVIPFEVNGRISGTNSIRSNFGFEDVRYTIDEYLYGKQPQSVHIKLGSAVRIMMDIIYPRKRLANIRNNKDEHFIF